MIRKDFTIADYNVLESAAAGADAILLIVAILDPAQLRGFRELAREFAMAALVEVHDEREVEIALQSGAEIIGVNNRDLRTFRVSLDTSVNLAKFVPASIICKGQRERIFSSSGRYPPADGRRLRRLSGRRASDEIGGRGARAAGTGRLMFVKICGITNREDALAAVDAGARALGIRFLQPQPTRSVTGGATDTVAA